MKPPSRRTIYRFTVYLRILQRLREKQLVTVSSQALAGAAGVRSAQLRKDISHMGQVGKRGFGYTVDFLLEKLTEYLGANRLQPVVLVGVGNLGTALLWYPGFEKAGFEIAGAFDHDPSRSRGREIPMKIQPMEELPVFIKDRAIKIALLAVPAAVAQETANRLISAGISAILNFAPVPLVVPSSVQVNQVDLALELENLAHLNP